MTPAEAVAVIDGLDRRDPEAAHERAEAVLVALVPDEVLEAYMRLVRDCPWWVTA